MTLAAAQRAIVVDASVAIELLLGNQRWIYGWRRWNEAGDLILVPPHFGHEVGNGLLLGARIDAGSAVAALQHLFEVGFEVADRGVRGLESSIHLAATHRLTVYDAAYLELAIDVDGELATLDAGLRAAATKESVPLVG